MGFSRQKYWSALPCPPPGDIPYPGIEPKYLMITYNGKEPKKVYTKLNPFAIHLKLIQHCKSNQF